MFHIKSWAVSTSYARREIKDLLAYLRVIENPEDDLAVLRIINVLESDYVLLMTLHSRKSFH